MNIKLIAKTGLKKLEAMGIEKAFVSAYKYTNMELQTEFEEIGLLREVDEIKVEIRIIHENKTANKRMTISGLEDLEEAVKQVVETAKHSLEDPAFSMAKNTHLKAHYGIVEADKDKMYSLLEKFLKEKKEKYPEIKESSSIVFSRYEYYGVSNQGSKIIESNGYYSIKTIYTAVKDEKSSSLNYKFGLTKDLPDNLLEFQGLGKQYEETIEQIDQRIFTDKFEGDVIFSPDTVDMLVCSLTPELGGLNLVEKTSIFYDKLNEKILSDKITLVATPSNPKLALRNLVSQDNYLTEYGKVIENGVLKRFNVSKYVSNKTDFEHSNIPLNYYEMDPGEVTLQDMIKDIKKGILVNRISSGNPNKNKDFSGIVKNSYYIEDGEIKYPISEIMITGNIVEMLNNVVSISQERENRGNAILPWVRCSNVLVSGK